MQKKRWNSLLRMQSVPSLSPEANIIRQIFIMAAFMNLRNLFKPEQFTKHLTDNPLTTPAGYAYLAQSILNEALDKAVRVYGNGSNGRLWLTEHSRYSKNNGMEILPETHQALLVCIEELPKKECEHELKILHPNEDTIINTFKCKHCNKTAETYIDATEVKIKTRWVNK